LLLHVGAFGRRNRRHSVAQTTALRHHIWRWSFCRRAVRTVRRCDRNDRAHSGSDYLGSRADLAATADRTDIPTVWSRGANEGLDVANRIRRDIRRNGFVFLFCEPFDVVTLRDDRWDSDRSNYEQESTGRSGSTAPAVLTSRSLRNRRRHPSAGRPSSFLVIPKPTLRSSTAILQSTKNFGARRERLSLDR